MKYTFTFLKNTFGPSTYKRGFGIMIEGGSLGSTFGESGTNKFCNIIVWLWYGMSFHFHWKSSGEEIS